MLGNYKNMLVVNLGPSVISITRKLSRYFSKATEAYLKAMNRVMTFCINISSQKNVADILTKNLPSIDYNRHTQVLGVIDNIF
jgi:hypothetical protein